MRPGRSCQKKISFWKCLLQNARQCVWVSFFSFLFFFFLVNTYRFLWVLTVFTNAPVSVCWCSVMKVIKVPDHSSLVQIIRLRWVPKLWMHLVASYPIVTTAVAVSACVQSIISCCNMKTYGMETCCALLTLCEGNPPVTGGFPSQRVRQRWLVQDCGNMMMSGHCIVRVFPIIAPLLILSAA